MSNTLAIIFFLISIFILGKFLRKSMPDWIKSKEIVGELILNNDSIEIHTKKVKETIELTEAKQIEISSNYHQGYSKGGKDITHSGLASISVQLKNESKRSFKFVIKNKKEFEETIIILKNWYKMKFPIHEFSTEYKLRSFLLQCNLKYAEIKKLKAEIYQAD
jgi:hypothetical protein